MKKNMRKIALSLIFLLIASCATKIKNFENYQKSPLLQTEFMPNSSALEKKIPSVVIFDFQTDDANAKQISATKMIEDYISEVLVSNKLANVQDRKNLSKLENEIKLSEVSGKGKSSIEAIDFAIDGNISSLTFSSEYQSETYNAEGKVVQPNRFQYTSSVQGVIKIYAIPSLKVVETISFYGNASKSEEVPSGGKIQFGKFKFSEGNAAKGKSFDASIAKDAVRNALDKSQRQFKAYFAKTGYILEKRVLEDKTIFLITLGSADGIKQDDKVQISQKYAEYNALTGKSEESIKILGTGIIADKTENSKTWIVVKDKKIASQIKLGDAVKITY